MQVLLHIINAFDRCECHMIVTHSQLTKQKGVETVKNLFKFIVAGTVAFGLGLPMTAYATHASRYTGHQSPAGCSRCMHFCNCVYPPIIVAGGG